MIHRKLLAVVGVVFALPCVASESEERSKLQAALAEAKLWAMEVAPDGSEDSAGADFQSVMGPGGAVKLRIHDGTLGSPGSTHKTSDGVTVVSVDVGEIRSLATWDREGARGTTSGLCILSAAILFHEYLHAADGDGGDPPQTPSQDGCEHLSIYLMTMCCVKERAKQLRILCCGGSGEFGLPPIEIGADDPCEVLKDLCAYLKDRNWKFVKGHPLYDFTGGYWANWNWCTGTDAQGDPNYEGPTSTLDMEWKDLPTPPSPNHTEPAFGDLLDCCDCE